MNQRIISCAKLFSGYIAMKTLCAADRAVDRVLNNFMDPGVNYTTNFLNETKRMVSEKVSQNLKDKDFSEIKDEINL